MPDLWMPGAEVHDLGDHAPTDQQYPPKAIAHITWDRNATAAAPQDWCTYDSLVNYFTNDGASAAPHIIWDPFSGRIAQLFPADSRSKSVVDSPGGTRTNRAGRVVIQIEAVFFPYCRYQGRVYPRLVDTPCAGWDRLHAWIASWGVPDVWPMGRPVDFAPHRDEATWETRGGWYAHAHVPENDHQDPGSWPAFTTAPSPAPAPSEEDPLAGITLDDIRAVVASEIENRKSSITHDVLYWLDQAVGRALGGQVADAGSSPLAWLVPNLGDHLQTLIRSAAASGLTEDQIRAAVAQALAGGLQLTVTTKGN